MQRYFAINIIIYCFNKTVVHTLHVTDNEHFIKSYFILFFIPLFSYKYTTVLYWTKTHPRIVSEP